MYNAEKPFQLMTNSRYIVNDFTSERTMGDITKLANPKIDVVIEVVEE